MKYPVLLSLIILAFLTGFAFKACMVKQETDDITEMKKPDRQVEEARIRKTEAAYDQAWQEGDVDGIMVCFTDDAVLVSPRGDVATGKEQIRSLLHNFLGSEARDTKHTSRITRISFVTDDVAVVDGEAFIAGSENLSTLVKHHSFTDMLVRTGDVWLISQIRAHVVN
jgi:uncharacterized protein (TIGR02246 family)